MTTHHWLDLRGTIANESAGKVVTLHPARRFTDSPSGESSIFRGLQGQFSAAGVGDLEHTSGWSDDVIERGRWDHTPTDALPAVVCAVSVRLSRTAFSCPLGYCSRRNLQLVRRGFASRPRRRPDSR